MLAAGNVADVAIQSRPAAPADQGVRCSAGGAPRPAASWLESRRAAGRRMTVIDLIGRASLESCMRPVSVIPGDVQRDLPLRRSAIVGNKQSTGTLHLHRPDEALDHGDASMLANNTEALRDAATVAPSPESTTSELLTPVGHKMPRRDLGLTNRALSERAHRLGGRLLREGLEADDPPGVVIDCDREPPAEGPALRQSERQPGGPEAERGGDGREIEMPDMVRVSGRDDASRHGGGFGGSVSGRVLFTGSRIWRIARGPPSSRRLIQDATVSGVTISRSAVCARLHPRAAPSSRMASLSIGV